jgi:hypothetical protein
MKLEIGNWKFGYLVLAFVSRTLPSRPACARVGTGFRFFNSVPTNSLVMS